MTKFSFGCTVPLRVSLLNMFSTSSQVSGYTLTQISRQTLNFHRFSSSFMQRGENRQEGGKQKKREQGKKERK